jgi:hypothetical protein
MHAFLRKPLTAIVLLISTVATAAAYTVGGSVTDASGEPLVEATIRVLSAKDSSFVSGGTTNAHGIFLLKNVNSGKYIVQASYIGYNPSTANVHITTTGVKLKHPIVLKESSVMLKEAVVTGVKAEIVVKEDTVEYNASSYKTQPGAVMEELLKKLPGVEVDSDGKITAHGKEVTKILVDGKEFFSDDPKVASKNLPATMIDKLQVVDRKSDLARLTGVDDGEEETVINLTVKKGMQNGWFGVINAGGGTDSRYAGDFNLNRFWNGNQMTVLGNFNNINQLGFTDSNGNRFRRFGGNNGITKSQSLGFNFNVGRQDGSFRAGGDVLYSHTDQYTRKKQQRQYIFPDSASYLNSNSNTRDRGNNVRGDFRIEWKPDSFNTIEIRPKFSFNFNRSLSDEQSETSAGDALRSLVNRSTNNSDSKGDSYEAGSEFWFNHKFKSHPGRSYSLMAEYSMTNVLEDEYSYSKNEFFVRGDSLSIQDQNIDNHTWSNTLGFRATWTEPLGNVKNGNFLDISYRMSYRWNNADKMVYDHPVSFDSNGKEIIGDNDVWNDSLSNRFRNQFFNQRLQIGYKKVKRNFNFNVGMAFIPSMTKSDNLINSAKDISRWVWNIAPYMRYRQKFSKTRSLTIDYRSRTSSPSVSQLQPVADYSNPLRIVVGNPNLDPSFAHNVRVRFQDFNTAAQRSIMLSADAQVTQNAIVSKTTYDSTTGGQTTTYTNVNGNWNAGLFGMFSMPLRNQNWQTNVHFFSRYTQTVGFNNGQRNRSGALSLRPFVVMAFRTDVWDISLRPFYGLQTTTNSLKTVNNSDITNYGATLNGQWYAPFGLVLGTDLSFTANRGYAAGYDADEWMWNAQVSYQFLRGRAATIALKAYDLLQSRKTLSRSVTANYIDDTSYNSLTRYFMLTFSYRFNTFGKGKRPEGYSESGPGGHGDRRGGPGGPGGQGGGRPGGGGPGF